MNMIYNGKVDGKHGAAFLVKKEAEMTTGALVVGKWYAVKARGEASVLPENVTPGLYFLCSKTATLAAGDVVIPLDTSRLLGQARDKSVDHSKSVADATTDIDFPHTQNIVDGAVSTTGTVNGYLMIDEDDSAMIEFMSRFETVGYGKAGAAGEADVITVKKISSPTELILIIWNYNVYGEDGLSEGDMINANFIPAILTGQTSGGSYGSPVSLNFNYTGQACDEDGCRPYRYFGPFHKEAA